jgi:chemotaxis protein MotB
VRKKKPIITKYSLFPIQDFEDEDEENSWQVSYLDIITIVLGFLIILLSVSQLTESDFSSLSTVFGKLSDAEEYFTTPIGNIQQELFTLLQPEIEDGDLEIIRDLNDLRVRFNSDNLYNPGEATLQIGSEDLIDRVLISMQQLNYDDFSIDVEGHTDNTPIQSSIYPSNWELSTARAANVVKYFNNMGISAKRLKASGYADSRPVIEYDSLGFPFAANKETNRRVVLRLYYSSENLQNQQDQDENEKNIPPPLDIIAKNISNTPNTTNTSEENVVILADKPAILTMADKNTIDEVKQAIERSEQRINQTSTTNTEGLNLPSLLREELARTTEEEIYSKRPSLLRVDATCEFSLQLGEVKRLQTAFKESAVIEQLTSTPVMLTYNGNSYSIRTRATKSFSNILNNKKEISDRLRNNDVNVLHQCYNSSVNRPKPVKYLIQFGAFKSKVNASALMLELNEKHNIQTFMYLISDTYKVFSAPYMERNEVLGKLRAYRDLNTNVSLFIRHQPETVFNYDYVYQIQVNIFSNFDTARKVAKEVYAATGINTRVENLNGAFSVMTSQTSSLSDTQAMLDQIKALSFNTNPIIFTLEYRP